MLQATLLTGRGSYLERVELDIGVPVYESLDEALHDLLGPVGIGRYFIAYFDDRAPVLGGQVLVGRAGCLSQQQSVWKLSPSRSAALQVKLATPTSHESEGRNRVVAHRLTRRMAPRPLLGTLQAMQFVQPLSNLAVVLPVTIACLFRSARISLN